MDCCPTASRQVAPIGSRRTGSSIIQFFCSGGAREAKLAAEFLAAS